MTRIERLRVEQFGGLADIDFTGFGSATVIHGPNESGKTTLVEFIRRQFYGLQRPNEKDHHLNEPPIGWLELAHSEHGKLRVVRIKRKGVRSGDEVQLVDPTTMQPTAVALEQVIGERDPGLFDHVFCLSVDDLHGLEFLSKNDYLERLAGAALFGSARSPAAVEKLLERQRDEIVKPKSGGRINELSENYQRTVGELHVARQRQSDAAASSKTIQALASQINTFAEQLTAMRTRANELSSMAPLLAPYAERQSLLNELSGQPPVIYSIEELKHFEQLALVWQEKAATVDRLVGAGVGAVHSTQPDAEHGAESGLKEYSAEVAERTGQFAVALAVHRERLGRIEGFRASHLAVTTRQQDLQARLGRFVPADLAAIDLSVVARDRLVEAHADVQQAQTVVARAESSVADIDLPVSLEAAQQIDIDEVSMALLAIEDLAQAVRLGAYAPTDLNPIRQSRGGQAPVAIPVLSLVAIAGGAAALFFVPFVAAILLAFGAAGMAWFVATRQRATGHQPGSVAEAGGDIDALAAAAGVSNPYDTEQVRKRRLDLERQKIAADAFETYSRRTAALHQVKAQLDQATRKAQDVANEVGLVDVPVASCVAAFDVIVELVGVRRELAEVERQLADAASDDHKFNDFARALAVELNVDPSTPDLFDVLVGRANEVKALHDSELRESGARSSREVELRRAMAERDEIQDQIVAPAATLSCSLADLVGAIRVAVDQLQKQSQIRDIERQIREVLGADSDNWKKLDNLTRAEVEVEQQELSGSIAEIDLRRTDLVSQRAAAEEQRKAATQSDDVLSLDSLRGEVLAAARHELRAYARNGLARLVIGQRFGEYERSHQPAVFERASRLLSAITGGGYSLILPSKSDDGVTSISLVDRSDHSWSIGELSRGTREQVYLSVRLALAEHLTVLGKGLPLILDDVTVDFDPQRVEALAVVLREISTQVQVVFLTRDPDQASLVQATCNAERFDLQPRRH